MAMQSFPEHFGAFRLYGPVQGTTKDGWTLSWNGEWLPGSYDSREAVFLVIGMFVAESNTGLIDEMMELLAERVNRTAPGRNISAEDILRTYSPVA